LPPHHSSSNPNPGKTASGTARCAARAPSAPRSPRAGRPLRRRSSEKSRNTARSDSLHPRPTGPPTSRLSAGHRPSRPLARCRPGPGLAAPPSSRFPLHRACVHRFRHEKKTGKRRWTKKPTSRARTTGKEMKIAKGISAGRVCCCRLRSQRCRLAIQPTAQPAAEAPALQGFAARPSLLPSLSLQLLEPRRGHEREKRTARCRWTNNTKRYSNVTYFEEATLDRMEGWYRIHGRVVPYQGWYGARGLSWPPERTDGLHP